MRRDTPIAATSTATHDALVLCAPGRERPCVGHHLALILLKLLRVGHLERHRQAADGVVVGTALQTWEDGLVDVRLKLLAEEDEACRAAGCQQHVS